MIDTRQRNFSPLPSRWNWAVGNVSQPSVSQPMDDSVICLPLSPEIDALIVSSLDLNPRLQTGRRFSRFLFIDCLLIMDVPRGESFARDATAYGSTAFVFGEV
jgi:hypothetical protein